jgi:hypothetical protein
LEKASRKYTKSDLRTRSAEPAFNTAELAEKGDHARRQAQYIIRTASKRPEPQSGQNKYLNSV